MAHRLALSLAILLPLAASYLCPGATGVSAQDIEDYIDASYSLELSADSVRGDEVFYLTAQLQVARDHSRRSGRRDGGLRADHPSPSALALGRFDPLLLPHQPCQLVSFPFDHLVAVSVFRELPLSHFAHIPLDRLD